MTFIFISSPETGILVYTNKAKYESTIPNECSHIIEYTNCTHICYYSEASHIHLLVY